MLKVITWMILGINKYKKGEGMLKIQRILLLILINFLFILCSNLETNTQQKPKNIILMIGDGMGVVQITSGIYSSNKPLNFLRFKNVALMTNHSYDNIVTDSAASATAMATGIKTYNGAVSVDPQKKPIKTIMELAKENGYNVGVVVTSLVTDSTPAAFLSHTEDRKNEFEIALDILDVEPNILLGGGLKYFKDRPDQKDLLEEFRKKGYDIYFNWEDLLKTNINKNNKILGLFADYGLPPAVKTMANPDSKYYDYLNSKTDFNKFRSQDYLVQMTRFAIKYLESQNKPFILLIEGSQIDWAGHNMDANYIIAEVLDFDNAIGEALNYAERDQKTLVIVTADHETGGFAIVKGQPGKFETKFIHSSHTSQLVPVFTFGPGSNEFSGIFDNTDIFKKIKKLWF